MAKPELGTKRTCPETGKKFYDLNQDPVVSPYTGVSYPLSALQPSPKASRSVVEKAAKKPAPLEDEDSVDPVEAEDDIDAISLEDADDEASDSKKVKTPDEDDEDIDETGDAEDDESFLEPDEDSDEDMTDIIGDREKDDEA